MTEPVPLDDILRSFYTPKEIAEIEREAAEIVANSDRPRLAKLSKTEPGTTGPSRKPTGVSRGGPRR